jgi:hypothetical protein
MDTWSFGVVFWHGGQVGSVIFISEKSSKKLRTSSKAKKKLCGVEAGHARACLFCGFFRGQAQRAIRINFSLKCRTFRIVRERTTEI